MCPRIRFQSASACSCLVGILLLASGQVAQAQSDDFNGVGISPQWQLLVDDPVALNLVQSDGRLNLLGTTGGVPQNDALYLSNGAAGFRLSTASDFSIQIDYSFPSVGPSAGQGSQLALAFGIGRDLDGTDSAAVAFGYADTGFGILGALTFGYRIDDVQTLGTPDPTRPPTGTLFITYNAASDLLALGDGTRTYTLDDTVAAIWQADSVYVSFGGRGAGLATGSGDATLDNFVINQGTVIPIPEPGTLALLIPFMLLGRRRRYSTTPTIDRS